MKAKGSISIISVALMLCVAACSEIDDLVEDIGSIRLYPIDPALSQATLDAGADLKIQVAEWEITRADLTLDGRDLDMLAGESSCTYADTAFNLPFILASSSGDHRCARGIVIGASDIPQQANIDLTLTMEVRRAEPLVLPSDGDYDGDGVLNDVDICPLVSDPNQEDDNEDGLGNACSTTDIFSPGVYFPDMDGDGVTDLQDNCIWIPNVLQEDTEDVPPGFFAFDGIGDACVDRAQRATVFLDGNVVFDLASSPEQFTQGERDVTSLVIDFNDDLTLDCNWDAESCTLDADQVGICIRAASVATLGCN